MYQKGLQGWLKHLDFLLFDLVCLNFSFIAAFLLQQKTVPTTVITKERIRLLIIFNIIACITALMMHAYKNVLKRGYYREFVAVAQYTIIVFLLLIFYIFARRDGSSESLRELLYIAVVIFAVLDYVCRIVLKRIVRFHMRKKKGPRMLIVTTSNIAEKVIAAFRENEMVRYTLAGLVIIDKDLSGKKIKGVPVVANVQNAADYVCREWVDEVFVDVHDSSIFPHKLVSQFETMGLAIHQRLANTATMAEAKHLGNTKTMAETKQLVEKLGRYTVLTTTLNYASYTQLLVKRLMDIVGGIIGCIGTLVVTLFVAPMIYISDPGPIFFTQERVGKNGKKFKIYKFRTMYKDAEERKKTLMKENRVKDGMMFKMEFDPRIIGSKKLSGGKIKKGIGGWLRTLSIDELPQFLNVLKGDMSLVGTRPPTLDEWEKYELHHRARLAIKPGITGMWQVSGRSKITDFEKVIRLDTTYIRDWSLLLDVKILCKTLVTVVKRDGSM